jgi:hypothetical protein
VQHVARFMFQPQRQHLLDFWLETQAEGEEGCEGGAGACVCVQKMSNLLGFWLESQAEGEGCEGGAGGAGG